MGRLTGWVWHPLRENERADRRLGDVLFFSFFFFFFLPLLLLLRTLYLRDAAAAGMVLCCSDVGRRVFVDGVALERGGVA